MGNILLWLANPDETLLRCRERPGLISSADMAAYGEAQGPSGNRYGCHRTRHVARLIRERNVMKLRDAIFGTTPLRRAFSALLVVLALAVGFASGAFAASESNDVTPGGAGSISLYSCPGGAVRSVARSGDRLAVEGRSQEGDFVAVRDPRQPSIRLWARSDQLSTVVDVDALGVTECAQDGEPADVSMQVITVIEPPGNLSKEVLAALGSAEWWAAALTTTTVVAADTTTTERGDGRSPGSTTGSTASSDRVTTSSRSHSTSASTSGSTRGASTATTAGPGTTPRPRATTSVTTTRGCPRQPGS
ncbi:MAG: hypothetical protein H6512_02115 [Acidimicrobiia bacterium]|nr:hypothetical protein [Acidimicrobiia bacterium]